MDPVRGMGLGRAAHGVCESPIGKPVDVAAIRSRAGWEAISALRTGRVYALPSDDLLSPGPGVIRGLRALHEIIQACVAGEPPDPAVISTEDSEDEA